MREHNQNHRLGNEVEPGEILQDTIRFVGTLHSGAFDRGSIAKSNDDRPDGSDMAGGHLISRTRGGESIREQRQS